MLKAGEDFFGTENDPNQIPSNWDALNRLLTINPHTLVVKKDKSGSFIGWAAFLPTTQKLMIPFLKNEINERQLFYLTSRSDYDAIYVISVFVKPEFSSGGYSKNLLMEGIQPLLKPNIKIFYEGFSEEGKRLGQILSTRLGIEVYDKANFSK